MQADESKKINLFWTSKHTIDSMECIEDYDFSQFSFAELVMFIKDMYSTLKICTQRRFSCGEEFIGIEYLKNKIDLVAKEMKKRIQQSWKNEAIKQNLSSGLRLPSEVVNFPEISEDALVAQIYLKDDSINSIEENGKEEIYISVKNKKYRMAQSGAIIVEEIQS